MANEKQLLIEALKKSHDFRFTPGVYEHSIYGKAALLLEKSEEVVRCKDCKHYVIQACACTHDNFNGIISMDGFCSYGERRTDEVN